MATATASRSLRSGTKRPRSNSIMSPSTSGSSAIKVQAPRIDAPFSSAPQQTPHDSPNKAKKLKLHSSFVAESPYPNFGRPTPEEALEVFNLLSNAHPEGKGTFRRKPPSESNNAAKTCASVPNVIEALIDTILSQNTSAKNSSRAKLSLDDAFGRNNFAAIASAPRDDVIEAIRSGGLANKKAATIQNVLHAIKARHGEYSLQHLAALTEDEDGHGHGTTKRMADEEIMKELISYDGVGPKTASCVLLFCLGRDSFAVDTHVFRLSKLLGWVPSKADRVLAQAHLDLKIPNELKYGLHVLMIQHGRICRGCKKPDSAGDCVLKTYIKERKLRITPHEDVDKVDSIKMEG